MKELRAFVSAGAVLLVGIFIITMLFSSTPASELTQVENETIEVSYDGWQRLDNASIAEKSWDNETVYNESGGELTEGTDYDYAPGNQSLRFYDTTATSSGANASVSYAFKAKPEMARASVSTISSGFTIAVIGVLILGASFLLNSTIKMTKGRGGGRR